MEWITLILTVITVIISFHLLFGKRSHPNAPPCIRGWIPWFGAAFEFGKAPLHFIQKARAKYGPVFTVVAAGKRLTFVTLNEDFRAFFTSKDVDFEQAVQEAVHNTASISKDCFYKTHPTCATVIKGRLTPGNTAMLSAHLCEELNDHLENLGSEGSGQLNELIKYTVMSNLLGRCNSPSNALTRQEFQEKFTTYDEGFEYGSQLPDMFLMYVSATATILLKAAIMKHNYQRVKGCTFCVFREWTLLQHLATAISDRYLPNYGLLLLWASLANAIPVSERFILVLLHSYKIAVDQINAEKTKVTLDDLQHMPYVKWCIMEAIRLRAPGAITRKVVRPLKLQNYVIPPGDMLMLSLTETPSISQTRKISNLKECPLGGFVAFGGGKNQCPGRLEKLLCLYKVIIMYTIFFSLCILFLFPWTAGPGECAAGVRMTLIELYKDWENFPSCTGRSKA
uniref:Cytochrome P450, family 39, subfamily A, polypeptide 1 n=1 Tax=Sinocyclocheilus rhinocerous TaxID=307959 RepID=A0A673LZD1_9TELE